MILLHVHGFTILYSISVVLTKTGNDVMLARLHVCKWVHYHSFVLLIFDSCVLSLAEKNTTTVECVTIMPADVLALPPDVLLVAKPITTSLICSIYNFT